MGAFFTNFQIHIGNNDKQNQRSKLINVIREVVVNQGYIETENNDDTDRKIIISQFKDECNWLTVYDELAESQEIKDIQDILINISGKLQNYCVGVSIYDSDVLSMLLFHNGKNIDNYISDYEYFVEDASTRQIKQFKGKPKQWNDLIIDNKTYKCLRKVWNSKSLFAEDMLVETADILGCDKKYCTSGFNYISNDIEINKDTILSFKLKDEISPEISRLPKFLLNFWQSELKLREQEKFEFYLGVWNNGELSKGFNVVLYGDVIEKQILKIISVSSYSFQSDDISNASIDGEIKQVNLDSGEKLIVAKFENFIIPRCKITNNDKVHMSTKQFSKYLEEQRKSTIRIKIDGKGLKQGTEEMYIAIVPYENRQDGMYYDTLKINILPIPKWRPIYSAKNGKFDDFSNRCIDTLQKKDYLFAYLVFEEGVSKNIQTIQESLNAWHENFKVNENEAYSICYVQRNSDYSQQIKRFKFKSKNYYNNNKFIEYRNKISELDNFEVEFGHEKGFEIVNTSKSDYNDTKYLARAQFWIDVREIELSHIEDMRNVLNKIANNLVNQGNVVQAFIACWGIHAKAKMSGNFTIYEAACDIQGYESISKDWCNRYLNGVSEEMWINYKLLSYLNEEKLTEVADIEKSEHGVRITLKSTKTLSDLEYALLPIIPSKEDFNSFQKK